MDSTTRLALNKPNPDPVTGDYVDITKLNDNFDKIDSSISSTLCTSGTRPSSPFNGQIIRETDTGRAYIYNGSSWIQILLSGASFLSHIESERPANFDALIRTKVTGDTQYRFSARADGRLDWGDGTNAQDTNLYRISANLLHTDDTFEAPGYRISGTSSGPAWVMTYSGEVNLGSNVTVPQTPADISGMSLTFTTRKDNAVVKAYYSFDFSTLISSAGDVIGRVWIAGTSYNGDSQVYFNGGNTTAGARGTGANQKRVVLGSAGSYSVKLQYTAANASAIRLNSAGTKLLVEVFE